MTSGEFRVEDYKLKLDYLKSQYDRLWQRFNFFLTVEMALFGVFGYLAFEKNDISAARLPVLLGLFVSLLWYVTSAEDRALVEAYRDRVKTAASDIANEPSLNASEYSANHVAVEVRSRFTSPLSWYWEPVSVTRLPVWIAVVHVIVWSILLACGAAMLKSLAGTSG